MLRELAPESIIEATATAPAAGRPRTRLLYALLFAGLLTLLARSFYLQIVRGGYLAAEAEGNRIAAQIIPAPRGIIYDANGVQLTENVAATDVVIDPLGLPKTEGEEVLMEKLPVLLELPPEIVQKAISSARTEQRTVRLKASVGHETVLRLEQSAPELPGVRLSSSLVRKYPFGQVTSAALGYASPVTADELESRDELKAADITGKTGLEQQYDQQLRGEPGVNYVEVNVAGKPQKQLERRDPVPGHDLKLNLDAELESYIMSTFIELDNERAKQNLNKAAGAVVAIDPKSGAVKALVSYPAYDANVFSRPELKDQARNIMQDEGQPMFNRTSDGTYPPGSTIKPLLAAAALQEGIITPDFTVLSTGGLSVGPWRFPDWKTGGHGVTDLKKAIAESVNTFFYIITGGDDTHTGLGVDRTVKYLRTFGWGSKTGVDLPRETAGFLPTPDWKISVKKEAWYIGDTYHMGIGQGDVLISPLQLATATSVIANGGRLYQPMVVKATGSKGKFTDLPTHSRPVAVSEGNLRAVREAMRETVLEGSGEALRDLPLAVAGKTGTAQIGGSPDTHAWFVSFAPYEQPRLVLTVLVEKGGDGDKVAVPLAKKIWEWWGENRGGVPKTAQ